MDKTELNEAGRQQVAVALVLLRQWMDKDELGYQMETVVHVIKLAQYLGVEKEYGQVMPAMPRYRFVDIDKEEA